MIIGMFEIIVFLCIVYVAWKVVDKWLTRANVQKAVDAVDDKIQVVRETKTLIQKRRDLQQERRELEKAKKIADLENENAKLKNL